MITFKNDYYFELAIGAVHINLTALVLQQLVCVVLMLMRGCDVNEDAPDRCSAAPGRFQQNGHRAVSLIQRRLLLVSRHTRRCYDGQVTYEYVKHTHTHTHGWRSSYVKSWLWTVRVRAARILWPYWLWWWRSTWIQDTDPWRCATSRCWTSESSRSDWTDWTRGRRSWRPYRRSADTKTAHHRRKPRPQCHLIGPKSHCALLWIFNIKSKRTRINSTFSKKK